MGRGGVHQRNRKEGPTASSSSMALVHENDTWHMADERWKAAVFLVWQVVVFKSQPYFIVEVLHVAALAWPIDADQSDKPYLSWRIGVQKLEWLFCFGF